MARSGKTGLLALCAAIVLAAGPASAETHIVQQSGATFTPRDLAIQLGDTVKWVWGDGIHTVTNGTGAADANAGALFDAGLTASLRNFTYTFNYPGVTPYFCRPHESYDMRGTVTVEQASGIDDVPAGPAPALMQNVPNPFNPQTVIAYEIPDEARVHLAVYDLTGRTVRVLLDGVTTDPGRHEVRWDGRNEESGRVAAGVYLYILDTGGIREARSMVMVR